MKQMDLDQSPSDTETATAGSVTAVAGSTEVSIFQVMHAAHEIEARLERALGEHELSIARFGVLDELAKAAEPLTLSDLAARLSCVRSNITQLVDRLDADGLVRRVPDPSDRRSIRAALTPLGIERQVAGAAACEAVQREVSARLPAQDRAALVQALAALG